MQNFLYTTDKQLILEVLTALDQHFGARQSKLVELSNGAYCISSHTAHAAARFFAYGYAAAMETHAKDTDNA